MFWNETEVLHSLRNPPLRKVFTVKELRDRIAEVLDREVDGVWEPEQVADVLIRELGLKAETRYVTDWQADEPA